MDDYLARIMGYANQGTAPFGALATTPPQQDEGFPPPPLSRADAAYNQSANRWRGIGAALKHALVGNPDATVPMRVDESGRPVAHKSLEAFSEDYPGETHPAIEAGANMALMHTGRALEPAYLAARGALAAPKTAAGVIGATALGAPSMAGEQQFKWSDPVPERTKEMDAIQKRINDRAEKITTLGTTSTKSPAGTQKLAIDQLSALNRPDSPDVTRLTQLRNESGADRAAAFEEWQTEQGRLREEAAAKKKAETSFFDVIPGTRSAMSAAAPVASYVGGKFLGRRLPVAGAMAGGAVGGALEGAAAQYLPTEVDLGLPRTSPTRKEAVSDLSDPAYWNRMMAVSGGNALLGAYGGFRGAMGRRLPIPPSTGPGGPLPVSGQSPANLGGAPIAPPSAAMPPTSPSLSGAALPTPAPYLDQKIGLWRDRNTGRFHPKPPVP